MTDILSGVYENISSPIHNINAKYKIPCFLAMIILTLAAKSYVVYIIDFLFLGICILISKLNIKHIGNKQALVVLFNNILNECPFLRQRRNNFKPLENQHNDTRHKARSSDSFKRNICYTLV